MALSFSLHNATRVNLRRAIARLPRRGVYNPGVEAYGCGEAHVFSHTTQSTLCWLVGCEGDSGGN